MLGKIAVMMFEECKAKTGNYYPNVSTETPSKINLLLLRDKNALAPKAIMKLITKQKNKSCHLIISLNK